MVAAPTNGPLAQHRPNADLPGVSSGARQVGSRRSGWSHPGSTETCTQHLYRKRSRPSPCWASSVTKKRAGRDYKGSVPPRSF